MVLVTIVKPHVIKLEKRGRYVYMYVWKCANCQLCYK